MHESDKLFLTSVDVLLDAIKHPPIIKPTLKNYEGSIETYVFNELIEHKLLPKFKKIRNINKIKPPCILLRKKGHPIVVLNKKEGRIIAYCPKSNKLKYIDNISFFDTSLVLKKISTNDKKLSTNTKNWTFKLLKKFTTVLVQASTLCTISNFLTLLTPIFIFMIFSQVNNKTVPPNLPLISVGIIFYIFISLTFNIIKSYTLSFIGSRLNYLISNEFFKRTHTQNLEKTNNINISKQIQQLDQISHTTSNIGSEIIERTFDIFYLIIMIFIIYLLAGSLAIVPAITFLLFLSSCFIYIPFTKKVNSEYSQTKQEINSYLRESVTNIKTIQGTNSEKTWTQKGKTIFFEKIFNNEQKTNYRNISQSLSNATVQISTLITIYIGVSKVINKEITVPELMGCVFFLWKSLSPLKSVLTLSQKLRNAIDTAQMIDQFMQKKLEEDNAEIQSSILKIKKIVLKNITIKYPKSNDIILRGISLTFNKTQTTLIVDKKSNATDSIIKIITGINKAQVGDVFINEYNLSQYNQKELRKKFSISPPPKIPFNLTIKDMFHLYDENVSDEKIHSYLKEFGLLNLKDKTDETFKNISSSLSNCELKRLSIALTFCKKTRVYIIENFSNGLSKFGKQIINKKLNENKNKSMIILTSTDIESLEFVDNVILIQEGKIAFNDTTKSYSSKFAKTA